LCVCACLSLRAGRGDPVFGYQPCSLGEIALLLAVGWCIERQQMCDEALRAACATPSSKNTGKRGFEMEEEDADAAFALHVAVAAGGKGSMPPPPPPSQAGTGQWRSRQGCRQAAQQLRQRRGERQHRRFRAEAATAPSPQRLSFAGGVMQLAAPAGVCTPPTLRMQHPLLCCNCPSRVSAHHERYSWRWR